MNASKSPRRSTFRRRCATGMQGTASGNSYHRDDLPCAATSSTKDRTRRDDQTGHSPHTTRQVDHHPRPSSTPPTTPTMRGVRRSRRVTRAGPRPRLGGRAGWTPSPTCRPTPRNHQSMTTPAHKRGPRHTIPNGHHPTQPNPSSAPSPQVRRVGGNPPDPTPRRNAIAAARLRTAAPPVFRAAQRAGIFGISGAANFFGLSGDREAAI